MISWQKAQEIIKQKAPLMPSLTIETGDAYHYVLAEDVYAISDLPPFDNSAMDGYALKSQNLNNKSAQRVDPHAAFAGSRPHADMKDEHAVKIMTGAKIPQTYDIVVPFEDVTEKDDQIIINTQIKPNQNIRKQGSDVQKGDLLITQGTKLNGYHLALLGAQGISEITVYAPPKVAIIITGNEVTTQNSDDGQIADANGPFLRAAIGQAGAQIYGLYYIKDDPYAFQQLIASLKGEVDMIISTGAVSVGDKDFIAQEIIQEGGSIHFHKIYQRPGKPLLFGALSDGTAWFGLPGNPVATQAGFIFSVQNWLNLTMGASVINFEKAVFTGNFQKKKDFQHFLRGYYHSDKQGQLLVDLPAGQASYQLKNWAKSNCWIVAPAGVETLTANNIVDIYRI